MDIFHVIILALLQGLTEFLPISSSAHLILPKEILGWPDQGLAFDVAVHIGTLLAVVTYFRRDVGRLLSAWFVSFTAWPWSGSSDLHLDSKHVNETHAYGKLAWLIIVATIPAAVVGLLLGDLIEQHLRSMSVIAATTIIFGLLLALADKRVSGHQPLFSMGVKLALIIGLAQAMALIPGTSRSGITITAALLLGFSREDSARFSFLMSIPVILLSGGFKSLDLIGDVNVDWFSIGLGILISAVSAYLCIYYFLAFINRLGMMPFVYYRLALGAILVALVFYPQI